ncbi:MAG: hypothetical protein IKZ06_02725 [Oscillospiraceae bacterium]|nr:hypothetical protein [Oscillospiraceae bacterium]
MKKRIVCALMAALMIVLLLPIQAFAVTNIKGAYVGKSFGMEIDTVYGAQKFSRSGNLPEGMKLEAKIKENEKR